MQRRFRMMVTLVMVLALMLNTFVVSPFAKADSQDPGVEVQQLTGYLGDVNGDPVVVTAYPENPELYTDGTNVYSGAYVGVASGDETEQRLVLTLMPAQTTPSDMQILGDPQAPAASASNAGFSVNLNPGTTQGAPAIPLTTGNEISYEIIVGVDAYYKSQPGQPLKVTLPIPDSMIYISATGGSPYTVTTNPITNNGKVTAVEFVLPADFETGTQGSANLTFTVKCGFPNYITADGTLAITAATVTGNGKTSTSPESKIVARAGEAWKVNKTAGGGNATATHAGIVYRVFEYTLQTTFVDPQAYINSHGRSSMTSFELTDTIEPPVNANFQMQGTNHKPVFIGLEQVVAGANGTLSASKGGTVLTPGTVLDYNDVITFSGYNTVSDADLVNTVPPELNASLKGGIAGYNFKVKIGYPESAFVQPFDETKKNLDAQFKLPDTAKLTYQMIGTTTAVVSTATAAVMMGRMEGEVFGTLNIEKFLLDKSATKVAWTQASKPTFKLYMASGTDVVLVKDNLTLDADGKITGIKVKPGKYYLEEVKPNDGKKYYETAQIRNGSIIVLGSFTDANAIQIADQQTVTVDVTNALGKLAVKKYKMDSKGTVSTWTNADGTVVMGLYRNNTLVASATVGNDGWAVFEDVEDGTYTLKEASCSNAKYTLSTASVDVTLEKGKLIIVDIQNGNKVFVNNEVTGGFTVYKTNDYGTTKTPLAGAVFTLYRGTTAPTIDAAGKVTLNGATVVATQTTAASGVATFTSLPLSSSLATGERYWVMETKAPAGYALIAATVEVTVTETSLTAAPKLTVQNPELGSITFTKFFEAYGSPTGINATATYTLYREDPLGTASNVNVGNGSTKLTIVDSKLFSSNGSVQTFTGLQMGTYWLVETATSADYKLSTATHTFEVKPGVNNAAGLVGSETNVPAKARVRVFKTDENNKPIEKVVFHVLASGTTAPILATLTSGGNGYTEFFNVDPTKDYVLKEVSLPAGYDWDNQNGSHIHYLSGAEILANLGKTITKTTINRTIRELYIFKYGEVVDLAGEVVSGSYVRLPGVSFKIFTKSQLPANFASPSDANAVYDYLMSGSITPYKDNIISGYNGRLMMPKNGANYTSIDDLTELALPAGDYFICEVFDDKSGEVLDSEDYRNEWRTPITDDTRPNKEAYILHVGSMASEDSVPLIVNKFKDGNGSGDPPVYLAIRNVAFHLEGTGDTASITVPLANTKFTVWRVLKSDPNATPEQVQDAGLSTLNGTPTFMILETDPNGYAISKRLNPNYDYFVKEIPRNRSYVDSADVYHEVFVDRGEYFNDNTAKVVVATGENGRVPVTTILDPEGNALTFAKVRRLLNAQGTPTDSKLIGIKFDVYYASGSQVKDPRTSGDNLQITTDTNGVGTIPYLLQPGTYVLKETTATTPNNVVAPIEATLVIPASYSMVRMTSFASQTAVQATAADSASGTLVNDEQASIKLEKINSLTGAVITSGTVRVTIRRMANDAFPTDGPTFTGVGTPSDKYDTSFAATTTSLSSGKVTISGLKPGKYELTETAFPTGYNTAKSAKYYFTLVAGQAYKYQPATATAIKLPNEPLASLKLAKTASWTPEIGTATSYNLPGALFQLFTYDGTSYMPASGTIATLTDANGSIQWSNLASGTYYIGELAAPFGYSIPATGTSLTYETTLATIVIGGTTYTDVKLYKVVVTPTSSPNTVVATPTFVNDNDIQMLKLLKTGSPSGTALQGVVFKVYTAKVGAGSPTKIALLGNDQNAKEWTTNGNGIIEIGGRANKVKRYAIDGTGNPTAQYLVFEGEENGFVVDEIRTIEGYQYSGSFEFDAQGNLIKWPTWEIISVGAGQTTYQVLENTKGTMATVTGVLDKAIDTSKTGLQSLARPDDGERGVYFTVRPSLTQENKNTLEEELFNFTLTDDHIVAEFSDGATSAYEDYTIRKVYINNATVDSASPVYVSLAYRLKGEASFTQLRDDIAVGTTVDLETELASKTVVGVELTYYTEKGVTKNYGGTSETFYKLDKGFECEGFDLDVLFDYRPISALRPHVTNLDNTAELSFVYFQPGLAGQLVKIKHFADADADLDILITDIPKPLISLDKGILSSESSFAGNAIVPFVLELNNHKPTSGDDVAMVNPVIADFLPPQLTYQGNVTVTLEEIVSSGAAPITVSPASYTYEDLGTAQNASGTTVHGHMWFFDGFELAPGHKLVVKFDTKMTLVILKDLNFYLNEAFATSANPINASEGTLDLFAPFEPTVQKLLNQGEYPELKIVDGKLNARFGSDGTANYIRDHVDVTGTVRDGFNVFKMVEGNTPGYVFDSTVAHTVEAGSVTYKLMLTNNHADNATATNVRIVDVLPKAQNDVNVMGGNRDSQWRPLLTGAIDLPTGYQNVKIWYATSQTTAVQIKAPMTKSNDSTVTTLAALWNGWTATRPTNPEDIYAVGFDFVTNNVTIPPQSKMEITLHMTAPELGSQEAYDAYYREAINDVMGYADFNRNGVPYYGVEVNSNETRITLEPQPVKLGNYVWYDTNGDGIQNDSTANFDAGLNGFNVELITSKTDVLGNHTSTTRATITEALNGEDGYYLFDNLMPNVYDANGAVRGPNYEYSVIVTVPTGSTYLPTRAHATVGTHDYTVVSEDPSNYEALDSDGEPVNGASPTQVATEFFPLDFKDYFQVGAASPTVDNLSNLTLDFGFLNEVALGDRVWEDVNRDGLQDADTTKEPGIANFPVQLYKLNDATGGYDRVLVNNASETLATMTDANGDYLFDHLIPGTYKVQFGYDGNVYAVRDDYVFTKQYAKSLLNQPRLASDSNAYASGTDMGWTDAIVLMPINGTAEDLTIDCGLYRRGDIGDFVWYDANADGVQDASETGVEGQTVFLVPYIDAARIGTSYFETVMKGLLSFRNGTQLNDSSIMVIIANATAALLDQYNLPAIRVDKTDADGKYLFEDVVPGKYVVYAIKDNQFFFSPELGTTDVASDSDTHSFLKKSGANVIAGSNQFEFPYKYYDDLDPMLDLTWDFGVHEKVSLGDYVWHDMNYDGIQNEGTTTDMGVNGVKVTLIKVDANGNEIARGTGDTTGLLDAYGKPIPTQLTRNGAHGSEPKADGFYLFDDLTPGFYKVEFDINGVQYKDADGKLHDYYFTLPNEGGDEALDSDVDYGAISNLKTTRQGVTDMVELISGVAEHDPYKHLDGGLTVPASLGDYVWHDLNYDGVQDTNEPAVAGVKVELMDEQGNAVENMFGEPVTATYTNASGSYIFADLKPTLASGTGYVVRFHRPDGTDPNSSYAKYDFFTLHGVGDDAKDSDANYGVLASNTALFADSHLIQLGSAQHDPTIDAGLVKYAAIGDYVWYDINYNGIQEANEAVVNGVRVELYDAQGNFLKAMNTGATPTDSNGNAITAAVDGQSLLVNGAYRAGYYYFGELIPSKEYKVRFIRPQGTIYDEFTLSNVTTTSDALDSDGVPTDLAHTAAETGLYTMQSGEYNDTVDAGLIVLLELGDRVWHDTLRNNAQDISAANPNEPGIGGVQVLLYRVINGTYREANPMAITYTDANGYYLFTRLLPGQYQVRFQLPSGYIGFVTPYIGGYVDDSNASPIDGFTEIITLVDRNDYTIDAGVYTGDTPPPTSTPDQPPTPPTQVPYGLPVLPSDTPPYGLPQLDNPPYGLPKTGESWTTAFGLIFLGVLMVGVGFFLMTGRKKDEQQA